MCGAPFSQWRSPVARPRASSNSASRSLRPARGSTTTSTSDRSAASGRVHLERDVLVAGGVHIPSGADTHANGARRHGDSRAGRHARAGTRRAGHVDRKRRNRDGRRRPGLRDRRRRRRDHADSRPQRRRRRPGARHPRPRRVVKILALTHRLPWAPNRGDRIRAYHVLQALAARHEIHLLSLVHDDEEAEPSRPMCAPGCRERPMRSVCRAERTSCERRLDASRPRRR